MDLGWTKGSSMKAKEFIIELKKESKPRNFVAKNASLAGKAGQHKDKKKAEKQGDVKHKKELATMESILSELSTEKLAQYKKAAGADAKKADADGNYSRGNKRFKGINQATNKQFDNDAKKGVAEGLSKQFEIIYLDQSGERKRKIVSGTSKEAVARQFKKQYKLEIEQVKQLQQGVAEGGFPKKISQKEVDKFQKKHNDKLTGREVNRQEQEKKPADNNKKQGVAERARDPEDWDEGNTEPPNNFAVYINGKKWKVFKGRGRYADDQREKAHYQQLKDWAAKKSVSSGKKWTVSITGETATESLDEVSWKGIKQGAAAAGLAGAMAFGAGSANARVTPDGQGGYTGGFKPTATVTAPSDNKSAADAPAAATPTGFSKQYLQKAANPDRFGRYMISVEKAQELLKQMDTKVGEGSTFAGAKVGHKEGPAGQWRNDGAKKNKPARPGDLVGGGM